MCKVSPLCRLTFALLFATVPATAKDDAPASSPLPKRAAAAGAAASPAADIPFPVDHDAPLRPTEKTDRTTEDYTRLHVEFNGIRKDRVPAYLYLPKGAGGGFHAVNDGRPRPAMLLQYGSGGNKKTNYIVALGEQFVKRGFIVLTIDVPHHGDRKPRGVSGLAGMFSETGMFPWYCGDYSRAIDYLMSRRDVDRARVGYAGISWGAITGLVFVAHEPRVRAMASIVGGGNFIGAIHGEVPPETREQARRTDPCCHVALIAPRPLLLLNVTKDQLVPQFFSESLHKAAGDAPSVIKRWVDTDHFFNGVDRYAILDQVVAFMEKGLEVGKAK